MKQVKIQDIRYKCRILDNDGQSVALSSLVDVLIYLRNNYGETIRTYSLNNASGEIYSITDIDDVYFRFVINESDITGLTYYKVCYEYKINNTDFADGIENIKGEIDSNSLIQC